jgi:translation initiation factor 2 alpha subunit (eIF-2alpha)
MNKQETLEEFAERLARAFDNDNYKALMQLVEDGAKWQQEKMYSEEEVEQIFNIGQMIKNYGDYKPYTFKEALEQFKKK